MGLMVGTNSSPSLSLDMLSTPGRLEVVKVCIPGRLEVVRVSMVPN